MGLSGTVPNMKEPPAERAGNNLHMQMARLSCTRVGKVAAGAGHQPNRGGSWWQSCVPDAILLSETRPAPSLDFCQLQNWCGQGDPWAATRHGCMFWSGGDRIGQWVMILFILLKRLGRYRGGDADLTICSEATQHTILFSKDTLPYHRLLCFKSTTHLSICINMHGVGSFAFENSHNAWTLFRSCALRNMLKLKPASRKHNNCNPSPLCHLGPGPQYAPLPYHPVALKSRSDIFRPPEGLRRPYETF